MAPEQPAPLIPHLLLLPFPAQGHIIPFIQLAETLASEGFFITFVCAEHRIKQIRRRYASRLSRTTIRLLELPDEVPVEEQEIDQGVDSMLRTIAMAEGMGAAFEQTVNRLMHDPKEEGVSLPLGIITDFYVSWSLDIATKFSIPGYVFSPSPSTSLAVMLYLPHFIAQGMIPISPLSQVDIPGLPLHLTGSDMPRSWIQGSNQEWRDFSFRNLLKLHESLGILVNTADAIEREAITAVRSSEAINPKKLPVYTVGPLLPSNLFKAQECSAADSGCLRWLDTQPTRSVLYISFGSIAIASLHQLQEIAKALDACEQVAFLWVLRLPPSATEDTVFPEGFRSRTSRRGLIISTWAPQLQILSHPSTCAFMSHCGWNSALESICNGVPILPLPQFAEQAMIGKMVTETLKVGVAMEKGGDGVAESREIEKAIREVLEGEEGRAAWNRSRALKAEAARAVEEGGSSHACLCDFVEKVTKGLHTRT